jgi:hypothetical protein
MKCSRTGFVYPQLVEHEERFVERLAGQSVGASLGVAILSFESGQVRSGWLTEAGGRGVLERDGGRNGPSVVRVPSALVRRLVAFYEHNVDAIKSDEEDCLDGCVLLVAVRTRSELRVAVIENPLLTSDVSRRASSKAYWLLQAGPVALWIAGVCPGREGT